MRRGLGLGLVNILRPVLNMLRPVSDILLGLVLDILRLGLVHLLGLLLLVAQAKEAKEPAIECLQPLQDWLNGPPLSCKTCK